MAGSRSAIKLFLLLLWTAASSSTWGAAADLPQGLRDAGRRPASQKGVDRHGNLWSFNDRSGSLVVISSTGELLHQARFEAHSRVDFDSEWGTLTLEPLGKKLAWVPVGNETPRKELVFPGPMAEVCWLNAGQVATSPIKSRHRVEIWDLERGQMLASFGEESEPGADGAGLIRLRHVLLRFDTKKQLLWTLETFTGTVEVLTLRGEKVASWQLDHPDLDQMQTWIKSQDEKLTAQGEREEAIYHLWPSLALDSQGHAWLIEGCDHAGHLTTIDLLPEGPRKQLVKTSCCERSFILWQDWMMTYSHSNVHSACNDIWRTPSPEILFALPDHPPEKAWMELTPVASSSAPQAHFFAPDEKTFGFEGLKPGLMMVCQGGSDAAISCRMQRVEKGSSVLEFSPGRPVIGRYVRGSEPCAAAKVRVVPVPLPLNRPFSVPLGKAKKAEIRRHVSTDRNGRFHLPRLAPGAYLLEAQLADGAIHHSESFEVILDDVRPGEEPLPVDLGDLVVDSGLSVEFLVIDQQGQGVAGAQVGGGQGENPEEIRQFQSRTGSDGRARVAGWDPLKPMRASCRAPGFSLQQQSFDSPPPLVLCELDALARLTGRVESEDGDLIKNAQVTLESGDDLQTFAVDEEGRFELVDLDAGAYVLTLTAPDFCIERHSVKLEPGARRELGVITLAPGDELTGTVVDALTGKPVAAAQIEVERPTGGGRTTADINGRFSLLTERRELIEIRVGAAGYADRLLPVPPLAEDHEELEVELSPGGLIRALVYLDKAGEPCVGCRLTLDSAPSGSRSLVTDEKGEALSRVLSPGRYAVNLQRISNQGSMLVVQGGAEIQTVEVRAHEVTTVRFEPRAMSAQLWLDPALPTGSYLVVQGGHDGRIDPSPDGSFLVPVSDVRPTQVFVTLPAYFAQARQGVLIFDDAGETVHWTLGSAELSGAISHHGEPAPGLVVRALSPTTGALQALAQTSVDGAFTLPLLQPGTYNLLVENQSIAITSVGRGESRRLDPVDLP